MEEADGGRVGDGEVEDAGGVASGSSSTGGQSVRRVSPSCYRQRRPRREVGSTSRRALAEAIGYLLGNSDGLTDELSQEATDFLRPGAGLPAQHLGDATVTAAILDRVAMTSVRLDIDGPSYRQHLAHLRAEGDATDPS